MTMGIWQSFIVDGTGVIQPGAQLYVRRETPGAPLIQLYADRDGTVTKGNPITADENGYAFFYAPAGRYRISSAALAQPLRNVPIGTAQEVDLASIGRPRGEWDVYVDDYLISDQVEWHGYLFLSNSDDNVGNEPVWSPSPESSEFWTLAGIVQTFPPNVVYSTSVTAIISISQADYAALPVKDPDTLYVIVG